ncbi:MAG: phosphatase PAP2 family protein [Luteitalea sp.]|nr:phosphatase PAP2 family protein [Luteitalea sp.]
MYSTQLIGATLALALLAPAGRDVRAAGSTADVVFEWNQILQDTVPGPQGVLTPRYFAMAHIAMFDAINTIDRQFEPYRVRLRQSGGGSPEAAAAQAAHDVLVVINPAATATYDAALARQLGKHPSFFVRRGAALGARVAKEILEWRRNDGWVVSPFPAYSEPLLPGGWQPTPPNNPVAAFTHLQNAVPMALLTATQYLPPPPPALTSERYATDLNEVRLIGRSDSATRTGDQTSIARLWNGVATPGTGTATNFLSIWNNIVRDVARERRLSPVETARAFVLVNVSVHDALQTAQASKFVYGLWRPVTAIQQADSDLNPATDPDSTWLPLLTTPPYPSYGGNMACIGASAARVLQLAFRTNDIPVTVTWRQSGGLPEVSHEFQGFWQVAEEQSESRIYGGIHYRFDQVAGQQIGRSAAEFVFANYMTPRSRWEH